MIDFQKAFDTINHSILLSKLEIYGIRGLPLQLISNYLQNRHTIVKINNAFSSPKPLHLGLPQGSVLSPILFLLYINDLPNISTSFKPILFADDTTLCFNNPDLSILNETCNSELEKFFSWTICNRLSINYDKTFIISVSNLFTNTNLPNTGDIILNGSAIKTENSCKFLGVFIDKKMKFDVHIQYISKKISKNIGILFRIRDLVPHQVLKSLYYSYIYPYLYYCIVVWGGTFDVHLNPLKILQKKAIRIINKQPYLAHTTPLFFSNGILKLEDIYKYSLGIHFYKYKLYDSYLRDHDHDTRFRDTLRIPFNRLVTSGQSVSERGSRVWNSLPDDVKGSASLRTFKYKLKAFYIGKYSPNN